MMRIRGMVLATVLGLLAGAGVPARAQHAGDMLIASTASGGGALAIAYDFAQPVRTSLSFAGPTSSLFSTTDPGWDVLAVAGGGVHPLPGGVPVTVEITAIDPGVSLKIGPVTLDTVGATRLLGTTPGIHVHPSWQLVLPNGTTATRAVSFRLTTTAAGLTPSVVYTATITNLPATTTTSTSSTTSTSTITNPTTSTTTTITSTTTTTTSTAVPTTSTTSTSTTAPTTTSTTSPPVDTLLPGTKLQLADGPEPKKRALGVVAPLPAPLGADDPTQVGASVRVRSVAGGFDVVYPLPASGWQPIGRSGVGGWKYADKKRLAGPVHAAVLKAGKTLKIAGKGAGLVHDLALDPTPVEIVVSVGARRWCLAFGGTVRHTPARKLDAKEAPAPAACAP